MYKVEAFLLSTSVGNDPDNLVIRKFCGRPLISWNLDTLQGCAEIHRIVVATDARATVEAVEALQLAKTVFYHTRAEDTGQTTSEDSILLEYLAESNLAEQDIVILTGAFAPFTRSEDYSEALDLFQRSRADVVVSAVRSRGFFWKDDGTPIHFDAQHRPALRDCPGFLQENGAFYISRVGDLISRRNRLSGNVVLYEMPAYSAWQPTETIDWLIGEQLMRYYRPERVTSQEYRSIKLLVSDVDGVLTDGSMYYTEKGDEIKRFHTYDGMAFGLMREKGIKTALITSEDTQMVANRAKKLQIDYLYQGRRHGGKLAAIEEICRQENIQLSEVAYIGDDINCREALSAVGFAFCPANALADIHTLPQVVRLQRKGGEGAVREVYEKYIRPSYEQ